MDAQPLLERDLQVEDGPIGLGCLRHQAGELPELRFLLARRRAEGGRVDRPDPLGEDPEAGGSKQLTRVVADFLQVLRPLDEDVGDREGVIERERGIVPALANLLGPDRGRDVDQEAAAVALAVDVSRSVEHLLQRLQGEGDRLVARGGVTANGRVEGAGVLVLHARRRDEGPVGALRGVALTL